VPNLIFERAPDEGFVMIARRSILVIEDERRIADLIARGLAGAGYTVDTTPDGVTGLRRSRSNHHDGVVLDLLLPDADGFELLHELVGEKPRRPVVVVSGLSEADTKVRCLGLGAADFVAKPFSVRDLVERIQARVHTAAGPGGRMISAGPISLDLARKIVDVGRGAVSLAGDEFALLQRLMARPGRVCSRDRLLEDVWGSPHEGRGDLLDGCVERLRSKLGHEMIETVWSTGYRIDLSVREEGW
jgi:DNA-binding response OmpR family regulator